MLLHGKMKARRGFFAEVEEAAQMIAEVGEIPHNGLGTWIGEVFHFVLSIS